MKNLLNERSRKLFQKLFENQGIDTAKYENYSREIREEGKPVEVAVVDWENAYDQVTWLFTVNGQDLELTSTGGIHTDDLADNIADALGEPYEDNPESTFTPLPRNITPLGIELDPTTGVDISSTEKK